MFINENAAGTVKREMGEFDIEGRRDKVSHDAHLNELSSIKCTKLKLLILKRDTDAFNQP